MKAIVAYLDVLGFSDYAREDPDGAIRLLGHQELILRLKIQDGKFYPPSKYPDPSLAETAESHLVDSFKHFLPFSDSIFIVSETPDKFARQLSHFLIECFLLIGHAFDDAEDPANPDTVEIIEFPSRSRRKEKWYPPLWRGGLASGEVRVGGVTAVEDGKDIRVPNLAGPAARPLNRQATLGMLLHVLKSCEDAGVGVNRRDVDGGAVFWPHYYSGLADDDNDLLRYQPAPAFGETHAFWRQFCAHQFLAFALEEFLAAVLDSLSPHPGGLSEASLLDELVNKEFVQDLEKVLKAKVGTPAALLNAIGIVGIPDVTTCLEVTKRFGGDAVVDEWSVCWDRDVSPQTRLGRAMLLLALLYGKWRGRNDEDALLRVADEAKGELWLGTTFPWLDAWHAEHLDWRQAVKRLLEWTTMRHDQVKFQKRKLDASWFELANGRFVKQQDIVPGFRASRHGNATTVLQDLGLIKHAGLDEPLLLTARGKQVLSEVIQLRK